MLPEALQRFQKEELATILRVFSRRFNARPVLYGRVLYDIDDLSEKSKYFIFVSLNSTLDATLKRTHIRTQRYYVYSVSSVGYLHVNAFTSYDPLGSACLN